MFDEMVLDLTCRRVGEGCVRSGRPREAEEGIFAYLADHSAIDGAGALFAQKRSIDATAAGLGLQLTGYEVDSGRTHPPGPFGYALLRLLRRAKRGGVAKVIVDHVSCMAPDYGEALLAAVTFLECGVDVIEARGGRVRREHRIEALVRRDILRPALRTRNTSITVLRGC